MMSRAWRALIFSLPAFRGGRKALRRPHPAGRAAFSTLPSPGKCQQWRRRLCRRSNGSSSAAAPRNGIPTTMSRCAPETAQGRHFFEIADYRLHKGLKKGKFVRSANFTVGGYDWCIRYCPEDDGEYIAVYLVLMTRDAEVRALYEFRLFDPATGSSSSLCCDNLVPNTFSDLSPSWGHPKFKKKSKLEASKFLQDDRIVIKCDVTVILGTPVPQSEIMCDIQVPPSNLADDPAKL